jgi:hypothetical protein
LEENKSLHLPLAGGGTGGLPTLTELDGIKVAPLELAGGSVATRAGEDGGSRLTGAGEDGGGDASYSSSETSSSKASSSEQPSSRDPSREAFVLSTGDPSVSLSVLVPAPLEVMTVG